MTPPPPQHPHTTHHTKPNNKTTKPTTKPPFTRLDRPQLITNIYTYKSIKIRHQ